MRRELALCSLSQLPRAAKQSQARHDHFFHGITARAESLGRLRLLDWQNQFQTASPCDPKFRVDVDNIDSRAIASRKSSSSVPEPPWSVRNARVACLMAAIPGYPGASSFLPLPCSAASHAYCPPRGQNVHSGAIYKLFGFLRLGKPLQQVGGCFVYFRAGSDVSDFSLDQHGRIDRLQRFYRLLGLAHIFFKARPTGQRRPNQTRLLPPPTPSRGSAYDLR